MTLVKYRNNPRAFNNLMDDFFATMPSLFSEGFQANSFKQFPAVNVIQHEGGYDLQLVAPGFEKEQFSIQVDDKVLTIAAEQKVEQEEKSGKQIRKEYELKSFKRSFTLEDQVDADAICAKYVNGVLTVNLPKKNDVKESKKQITVG